MKKIELTMDDLVKRDGLYYRKFTDVPFTGKTTGQVQISYKDGKIHGPYVVYYDNGQLSSKAPYKDGKQHGPWLWYDKSGKLRSKENYKNGKEIL